MCPICLSSVAWLIAGGISVVGATARGVAVVLDRKLETGEPRPDPVSERAKEPAVEEPIGTGETHGQE